MRAPLTLGLYGAGLAAVFAASYAIAGVVVPASAADEWMRPAHDSATDPNGTSHVDD